MISIHHDDNIRLLGRDREMEQLRNAYDRSTKKLSLVNDHQQQEIVLIRGSSGTGKTFLANAFRPHVLQDGGFFLHGKFDFLPSQDPYAVFTMVMTQFADTVSPNIEVDERMSLIQASFQDAVGQEAELVLTKLFPSLANIFGEVEGKTKSTADDENKAVVESKKLESFSGATEAKRRFHFVFSQLLRAISAIAPLVLFIDDLQWGDQASLDLLQAVLELERQLSANTQKNNNNNTASSWLCILTFRDEENDISIPAEDALPDPDNPADESSPDNNDLPCSSLLEFIRAESSVTEIGLQNFNVQQLNDVISGMLYMSVESSLSLTKLVYKSSNGNIFQSLQVLRHLQQELMLRYSAESKKWIWSTPDDSSDTATTSDAEETVVVVTGGCDDDAEILQTLPTLTREILKVAACMANEVDETALTTALGYDPLDVIQSLETAAQADLLAFFPRKGRYQFAHDRIRQAALSGISNVDDFSFQIGYQLMKKSSASLLDTITFTVVNLLNRGVHLLVDLADRYQAATLNLEAGLKAVSSAAFPDACRYFEAGIAFLNGSDYWSGNYQLSLSLHDGAIDAELCIQHFDRVAQLVAEIYKHARSDRDKIRSHVARIQAIGQRGSVQEAVKIGLGVLKSLGETMTAKPGNMTILWGIVKASYALKGSTSDSILAYPVMRDELKQGAVHILTVLLPYAVQSGSPLTVLIGIRLVQLCLKYGICKECSHGFVTMSWLLCKSDRQEGYRIGQLAMSIVEKLAARELIPRVHIVFCFFTSHWVRSLKESLPPLQHAYKVGMEVGDVEYAMFAAMFHAFYSGMALPDVEKLLVDAKRLMRLFKQDNSLEICNQLHQFIHNLTRSDVNEPKHLAGEIAGDEFPSENVSSILVRLTLSTTLAHMFGDIALAEQFAHDRKDLKRVHFAFYHVSVDTLLEGLIAVGQVRRGVCRRRNKNIARRCLHKLHSMVNDCHDNYLDKEKLLEAELCTLSPRNEAEIGRANELYGEAYTIALRQGFTYEAALACELAGDFMYHHENGALAAEYSEQAHLLYTKWGAVAKARHFRARINEQLNVVL